MTFYPADVFDVFGTLSDAEQTVIRRLRDLLDRDVAPVISANWEAGTFPQEIVAPMVAANLMTPPEISESGELPSAMFEGFRNLELARTDASIATFYNAVSGLFRTTVNLGGSPDQVAEWDPQICSFEFTGAFALTEPDHGSDVARGLETTTHREGDEWIISGSKRWIGGCNLVNHLAVIARGENDGKVYGFLIPKETPGVTLTQIHGKTSLRIMPNFDIALENVRVPERMRLQNINTFNDVAALLRSMRSTVGWIATGAQMGAYEASVKYVTARQQFGKPLAGFQLIQEKLATMLANITASLAMVHSLTEQQSRGIFLDENSAMTKRFCSARLRETVALAREVVGGNGIVLENNVARFHADAEAIYSYEGTDEINALIVGRAITGISAFK